MDTIRLRLDGTYPASNTSRCLSNDAGDLEQSGCQEDDDSGEDDIEDDDSSDRDSVDSEDSDEVTTPPSLFGDEDLMQPFDLVSDGGCTVEVDDGVVMDLTEWAELALTRYPTKSPDKEKVRTARPDAERLEPPIYEPSYAPWYSELSRHPVSVAVAEVDETCPA